MRGKSRKALFCRKSLLNICQGYLPNIISNKQKAKSTAVGVYFERAHVLVNIGQDHVEKTVWTVTWAGLGCARETEVITEPKQMVNLDLG